MKEEVFWTDHAIEQLDTIYNYISQTSNEYALRIVDKLTARTIQISTHPKSGRKVPEFNHDQIREIIESGYRIIYHIKAERIDIISVIHGAMNIS